MLYGILSMAAAAVLVGIDQWLKAWATANLLPGGVMPLIPGIVELRYSLNQGMAFSLLWGKQTFLIAITSIALLAVAVYLFWKRPPLVERIAWTMVLGGGVGNLIDRIASGQVVDYLNFQFVDFAIFNFADICVTGGIALLILSVLVGELRDHRHKSKEGPDADA
ncbi:signal peptidase II [uncultured Gemmiger sp.]|uniref:signal peptidase II n=1 Tax=uncultured Gemmiger sp. TaxID=1623490 RepID=UPI0025FDD139|nr:signal peptidase II [uncultured Gemmiger sp.]